MTMEITGIRQQAAIMENRPAEDVQIEVQRAQAAKQLSEARKLDLPAVVDQIQKIADMFKRELKFQISDDLNMVIIKVIDSSTDKVIREIPSQEIQRLQSQIQKDIGLIFDKSI